jgi:hypothetical protein
MIVVRKGFQQRSLSGNQNDVTIGVFERFANFALHRIGTSRVTEVAKDFLGTRPQTKPFEST